MCGACCSPHWSFVFTIFWSMSARTLANYNVDCLLLRNPVSLWICARSFDFDLQWLINIFVVVYSGRVNVLVASSWWVMRDNGNFYSRKFHCHFTYFLIHFSGSPLQFPSIWNHQHLRPLFRGPKICIKQCNAEMVPVLDTESVQWCLPRRFDAVWVECERASGRLTRWASRGRSGHARDHTHWLYQLYFSCYKCFSDEQSLLEHIPKHKESKHLKVGEGGFERFKVSAPCAFHNRLLFNGSSFEIRCTSVRSVGNRTRRPPIYKNTWQNMRIERERTHLEGEALLLNRLNDSGSGPRDIVDLNTFTLRASLWRDKNFAGLVMIASAWWMWLANSLLHCVATGCRLWCTDPIGPFKSTIISVCFRPLRRFRLRAQPLSLEGGGLAVLRGHWSKIMCKFKWLVVPTGTALKWFANATYAIAALNV